MNENMSKVEKKANTTIEEIVNPRTGITEIFLNGNRLEDIGDDQTDIQLEILKNLLEGLPSGQDIDEKRNKILRKIANHLGDGNDSLISIKDVLVDIYDKIGDSGASEEIERVKEELLLLIHFLDQKIDESKLVAGDGIIIRGNVISTTGGSYIDKLINDYELLKNQYDDLLSKYTKLQADYNVLTERYNTIDRERLSLIVKLKEMTKKYEDSIREIAKLKSVICELEKIIATGEDYDLYKKYKQLYYKAEAEARKYKKDLDDLTGATKWQKQSNRRNTKIWCYDLCSC